jgi:hypothetical protein
MSEQDTAHVGPGAGTGIRRGAEVSWSASCGDVVLQGSADAGASAGQAAAAAAADVARAALEQRAGQPVATLPPVELVVDGQRLQLRAGLDDDGRLDREATTAAALRLLTTGA